MNVTFGVNGKFSWNLSFPLEEVGLVQAEMSKMTQPTTISLILEDFWNPFLNL